MSKAIAVTQKDWQKSVLNAETPVVVDFWAPWCGPCRAVAPILEDLANEYDGKVQIVKVNVDEEPMLSGQYGVQAIPTMIVFKNGKEIERVIGELTTVRDLLRNEGERVQREITGYASLSQAAMTSMKIIADSLAQWNPRETQTRQGNG